MLTMSICVFKLSWHLGHLHLLLYQTDRPEKANYSYNNDVEKNHVPSLKNLPPIIHHDAFVSNAQNDQSHARLVPLEGCSASEAAQLHSERMFPSVTAYQYCPSNCLWNFFDRSSYLLNAGNCCMLLWWDIIRRVT
jgi:hypothetical protein